MAGEMTSDEKRTIHILLLGKTGTGKSSTANTILGRKEFKASGHGGSVTENISQAWVETDKFIIKIVDGPGLEDTKISKVQDKERAIKNIGQAIRECGNGVNAFVFVIKWGERFTQEDRDAVDDLKKIVGDKMGNFSIVVLTRGDEWEEEHEAYPFQQWCKDKDKDYHGIFSFCGYRCVLFENRKPSESQKRKQMSELLMNVDKITMRNGFYTNHVFEESAKERAHLIVKLKAPVLKEKFQKDISLLSSNILKIVNIGSNEQKVKDFRAVIQRARGVLILIEKEDQESGELNDLKKKVNEIIKAAQENNSECLEKLRTEIETIRQGRTHRSKLASIGIAILTVAGSAAAGAAVVATGGAALVAFGASAVAAGTSLTTAVVTTNQDKQDDNTVKTKTNVLNG